MLLPGLAFQLGQQGGKSIKKKRGPADFGLRTSPTEGAGAAAAAAGPFDPAQAFPPALTGQPPFSKRQRDGLVRGQGGGTGTGARIGAPHPVFVFEQAPPPAVGSSGPPSTAPSLSLFGRNASQAWTGSTGGAAAASSSVPSWSSRPFAAALPSPLRSSGLYTDSRDWFSETDGPLRDDTLDYPTMFTTASGDSFDGGQGDNAMDWTRLHSTGSFDDTDGLAIAGVLQPGLSALLPLAPTLSAAIAKFSAGSLDSLPSSSPSSRK